MLARIALVALLCAAGPAGAHAQSYEAELVHLRDGDSLIVRAGDVQKELRIAEIDAPERGQPWSKRATRALATLLEGRRFRVEVLEIDRYGREVSRLFVGDDCVGCALVRDGHAWAYRKYLRSEEMLRLEREARAARRGLWSLPASEHVPPWEWRDAKEEGRAATPERSEPPASAALACGSKQYCNEMASCAEARFHLERCGLARIDGDGNGVPCERLCSGAR